MQQKPDISIDLHLVLIKDGRVLMGERRNTPFGAGQYHVPAGHLEPNETIIDGMIREAHEETGIGIAAADLELVHVLHLRGQSDRLSLFFTAQRWTGDIENREPDKCAGWHWFSLDAPPANTVAYARQALDQIAARRTLSVFGWST